MDRARMKLRESAILKIGCTSCARVALIGKDAPRATPAPHFPGTVHAPQRSYGGDERACCRRWEGKTMVVFCFKK